MHPEQQIELESRNCVICSRPFRVHPKSQTITCSRTCLEKHSPGYFSEKRLSHLKLKSFINPKIEVPLIKESIVETPTPVVVETPVAPVDPREKKWTEYVERSKSYVSKMAKFRLEIATMALEVCEIHWGGGTHWKGFETTYTLKRFAEETGISYKTLANWVRIKRNVYDKLVSTGQTIDPIVDWSVMMRVSDNCKKDETSEQVKIKYDKWSHGIESFSHTRYSLQALRKLRSFDYFLKNKAHPSKCLANEFAEIEMHCKSILQWIKTHKSKFKKVNKIKNM